MSSKRRILSDTAKLVTSTAGLLQGAGREAETLFRQRMERMLDRMDLVTREEFDAVKAMATAARLENEALAQRLAKLEAAAAKPDRPVVRARRKKAPPKTGTAS